MGDGFRLVLEDQSKARRPGEKRGGAWEGGRGQRLVGRFLYASHSLISSVCTWQQGMGMAWQGIFLQGERGMQMGMQMQMQMQLPDPQYLIRSLLVAPIFRFYFFYFWVNCAGEAMGSVKGEDGWMQRIGLIRLGDEDEVLGLLVITYQY